MESVKKNKLKKIFSYILPLLFAGLFGYGAYSFFYEFKRNENIVNIILNLILILVSLSAISVLCLKKKGKAKKQIIISTVIANIFSVITAVGFPYIVNLFLNNDEWEFSVALSLEMLVFAAVLMILSYYISSANKAVKALKVILSGFVAEISLKSVTALLMIILMLVSSLTLKSNENQKFKGVEIVKKTERGYVQYSPNENDIYVNAKSQNGNGSKNNPFNSVEEAKARVEKLRLKGVNEHINIWLYDGEYFIEETLKFEKTYNNISFNAYPDAKPSFTGAKAITDFTETTQNGVKVFVADVSDGMEFDSVIKDGKTLPKTRYPESGYLTVETEDHTNALWTEENRKWEYNLGDTEFIGNSQYNPKNIKNIENVAVRVLHYWVTDFAYLKAYDANSNKYILSNPTTMTIKAGDRYYFENVLEELNSPGEWYLDNAENKLYYVPFDDESAETTVLYACVNDKLIEIDGAQNINFNNISFENTNFTYPEEFDDLNFFCDERIKAPQAEIDVGGAVEVVRSTDIGFINCEFEN